MSGLDLENPNGDLVVGGVTITPQDTAALQYQITHPNENRGPELIAVDVILWVLAAIAVFLRIKARRLARVRTEPDDYLIVICLALLFAQMVNVIFMERAGMGRHALAIGLVALEKTLIKIYITQIIYAVVFPLTKISVLLFYYRIFPIPRVRVGLVVLGSLMTVWFTASFFAAIFTCSPINYFWTRAVNGPGHCFDTVLFYNFNGGLNVLTDLILLSIPVPIVLNLKLAKRERAGILFIFLIGIVTSIASIVRVTYMRVLAIGSLDPTYGGVTLVNWTNVECCFGVVCACLPSLRSLLVKYLGFASTHASSQYSSSSPSSKFKKSWPSSSGGPSSGPTLASSDRRPSALSYGVPRGHLHSGSLGQGEGFVPLLVDEKELPSLPPIEPTYRRTTWQDIERGLPLRRVSIELDIPFLRDWPKTMA